MSTGALVFVEQRAGRATDDSLALVSKAATLGVPVAAAVLGGDVAGAAQAAAEHGAGRVYAVEHEALTDALPAAYVEALAGLVAETGAETVLLATSVLASDVAGGLAVRLGAGLNWELSDLALRGGEVIGTRLALDDTVQVEVGWVGTPRLALFRAGSFEAVRSSAPGEVVAYSPSLEAPRARVVSRSDERAEGPAIEDAEVLVGAGRGVASKEEMALLEELAAALGGAVAVTMPLVDRGWYPYAAQVGQTGKSVRPRLYVACGVSGAVQHRIGMERSGTIVAINTDPAAPIFNVADLAVVGDLHAIVPRLTELVRGRTNGNG